MRRCVIRDLLETRGVQESVLQDQSPVSSLYASDASDTDDVSVDESREPRGMYCVNPKEEEDDLLATHRRLLKKNAEMEKRVNKAEKRVMELRTHLLKMTKARELLEAGRVEFNGEWEGSGKNSKTKEEPNLALTPVLPALLSPLAGGEAADLKSEGAADHPSIRKEPAKKGVGMDSVKVPYRVVPLGYEHRRPRGWREFSVST